MMDAEYASDGNTFYLSRHTLHVPTISDIKMLYHVMLGREPESGKVIEEHRRGNLADAIRTFIRSPEFREYVVAPIESHGILARNDNSEKPSPSQLIWFSEAIFINASALVALQHVASWTEFFERLLSLRGFKDAELAPNLLVGSSKPSASNSADRLSHEILLPKLRNASNDTVQENFCGFDRVCNLRHNGLPPLPNLIGVGAGRCGTTSLYSFLKLQSNVYMSPLKEINYFGHRSQLTRGPERGLPVDSYRMFFSTHLNERLIGEISPIYLTQKHAAGEMHQIVGPTCKIIIQLRHPVDRFVSQYRFHLPRIANPNIRSYVNSALNNSNTETPDDWFSPSKNLAQSLYLRGLQAYLDLFGKENVLIIEYRELTFPAALVAKLENFLGVGQLISQLGTDNASQPSEELSADLRQQLLRYFGRDIPAIQALTDLDLSHWRR